MSLTGSISNTVESSFSSGFLIPSIAARILGSAPKKCGWQANIGTEILGFEQGDKGIIPVGGQSGPAFFFGQNAAFSGLTVAF